MRMLHSKKSMTGALVQLSFSKQYYTGILLIQVFGVKLLLERGEVITYITSIRCWFKNYTTVAGGSRDCYQIFGLYLRWMF